jgi:hypothetical protein
MATTWTVLPMRIARSKYDAAPLRNEQFIEASSAAYIVGEPLQQNASAAGAVETWTASSTTIIGVSIIAAGGGGSQAFFEEVHEGTILEANVFTASSSGAAAFAQTDIGALGELDWQASSSAWVVNLANASSANHVTVVGLAGMGQIGDVKPRVEFIINAAFRRFEA